jgi:SAM-dependent methyltransferase
MESLWYQDVRAYDRAFAFEPEREVALLLEVLKLHGRSPPAKILEPMAGTGRLLHPLQKLGYRVLALDSSLPMLLGARKRGVDQLVKAEASRFALAPEFSGAFCLIDSFRYLLSFEAALDFLNCVGHSLRLGSPFVLELELASRDPVPEETWTTQDKGGRIRTTIRSHGNAGPGLQWMDSRVEMEEPAGPSVVNSRARQKIWSPVEFLNLLDAAELFEVFGIYRRGQSLERGLQGVPPRGGPVIVVLTRSDA